MIDLSTGSGVRKFDKLHQVNKIEDFFIQLIKLTFKLEDLAIERYKERKKFADERRQPFDEEPRTDESLATNTISLLDQLQMYDDSLTFLCDIWGRVYTRAEEDNFKSAFEGFDARSLKEVVENGVDVSKRLGGDEEMAKAKTALLTKFDGFLKRESPKRWAQLFKDSAKTAYNLQYMFREDMDKATEKFREKLSRCPARSDGQFGDVKLMFTDLLNTALDTYGEGLVDQDKLAQTDFTNNPGELIQTVLDKVALPSLNASVTIGNDLQMIGKLTAQWMAMLVHQDNMPLTPHHTQVTKSGIARPP